MEILLVQPIKNKKHTLNLVPSLGLGYLASSVRPGHDVKVLDCVKESFDIDDFKVYIEKNTPDVVGFTAFSCDLDSVRKSIKVIKEINPVIITVAGGPHPSGDPNGTMQYIDLLDFVFAGEAEKGFPIFIEQLSKKPYERNFKDVPGLVWRENGKINSNPKVFVEDLDTIKFPSWDLLKLDKYKGVPNGVFTKQYPFAPIIITRGCPYLCTFCSAHNIVGRKLRYRSMDNVIEEIKILYEKYGIKEIHIEDDNFTFNIEFAKEFCNRLIKLGLPLTYSCPNGVRLDRIDIELLSLMKKAGFYNIYVGIESGSSRILKHMRKNLSLEEISKKVDLIKESGLEASGYFMLGYPEETVEDMKMTISFARSLKLDWAQFATFIPIPGSDILKDEYVKKIAESISWSDFFNTDVPFAPRGVSRKQLKGMQKRAFLRFYFRPGKILNLIKKIRKDNFIFIFRRIISYFS